MKSNVSDCLELVRRIYIDSVSQCSADVSDLRDLKTIRSRVKDEGLSFLTITLPDFCRDFERALELGQVDSKHFLRFRKCRAIPHFFRGMLSRVFDVETGRIYDENSAFSSDIPSIVMCVRQICLTYKKVELECSPNRKALALENFVAIEHSFEMFSLPREDHEDFLRVSSVLWDNMLCDLRIDSLSPRHGPGATADYRSGNQKYNWRIWHERLEPYFPIIGNGYSISVDGNRMLEDVSFVSSSQEQPVRVTLVPKTLKGPRIIAIEPCCMQYTQQGIRSSLYEIIESNWITSGSVNFTDQSINQALALSSSITGQLVTIDLSDASDRVPRWLALEMFNSNPDLRDAIDACRSTHAMLPNGTVIGPLKKFASMGSALCFPIEAMYFYTICIVALFRVTNLPVTFRNLAMLAREVHIYGDDIIVPRVYADTILDHLRKYNCKVNSNKTFVTGKFRESCGVDAYDGMDVTPTYIRHLHPKNRRQASRIISWVSSANAFYKRGYWNTAQYMFSYIERILGSLPYVSEDSEALGRYSYLGYRTISRWGGRYQRPEVKAWVPKPIHRTDELEGYGALVKCLQGLEDLTDPWASRDKLHLEHSELGGEVAIHRRWVPVT